MPVESKPLAVSGPRPPALRRAWPARVTTFALALACAVSGTPTSARQPEPDTAITTVRAAWRPVDPEVDLEMADGAIQLALEDAIIIALKRNLGLQVERFTRAQALFRIEQNLGIYDLLIGGTGFMQDETTPAATQLEGAAISQFEVQGLNGRLDQLNPYGGTFTVDWRNDRTETNSIFADINPNYGVDFDLVYTQPLLRDFGKLATNRFLRIARIDSSISLEGLEQAVIALIERVEFTYWTLVESRAQLEVAEESLTLANQLHEMNRVQVDVGTKAPLELVQSEAGIATRQETIIRVSAIVEDAADLLRRLLNLGDEQHWNIPIVPTTGPETDRIQIDLEEALSGALAHRPELAAQRLTQETLEIDERFFRNQKLPTVDFQVRYGYNGIGGDAVLERDPVTGLPIEVNEGGYEDAVQQVLDRDFKGWQLGVNFAYPLQNRTAKANHTIARLAVERGSTVLQDLEQLIRTDVRAAARNVDTAAQQIDSAGKSRELAERNLEAEQKKYENGLSTSFQVLEIQEDLSEARSREVNAITGYRRSLVRYYQAIGTLLEANSIALEDVTDPDQVKPETE